VGVQYYMMYGILKKTDDLRVKTEKNHCV
jgi:hypothetical protein